MKIRDFVFKIFKGATVSLGCVFVSFSFILATDLINKMCLFGVGAILLIAIYLLQHKNRNTYVTLCIKAATLFLLVWIFFKFGIFGFLSYGLSSIGIVSLIILIILKIVDFFIYENMKDKIRNKDRL